MPYKLGLNNMAQPLEKIEVDAHADGVSCDGGGGSLGHPKVWYSFDGQENVSCGYCGRFFVKSHL